MRIRREISLAVVIMSSVGLLVTSLFVEDKKSKGSLFLAVNRDVAALRGKGYSF
jgi:hypothetical protein